MGNRTPLYEAHLQAGAKMVDFAGWDMPLHYGSQLEEHHFVRKDAGLFDVSHMTIMDLHGPGVEDYLCYLLANDIKKLQPGKALYSCMLNEHGGVIDDLIVYYIAQGNYRLVVNSATREKDLAWLNKQAVHYQVVLQPRPELAIIAVQGPNARSKLLQTQVFAEVQAISQLKPFQFISIDNALIACTGYTGEDGFEMMLPADKAISIWQALIQQDIKPCGLGARDTLRLEAGLNLYGNDMDETTSPLESNLAWTVNWEDASRDFLGKQALLDQQAHGIKRQLMGLLLVDKGVLRSHQKVIVEGYGEGETTSGTFSPTLGQAIALARIPITHETNCKVDIRGKLLTARIVKPPFVRRGKILI